jgi:EpsI family protein
VLQGMSVAVLGFLGLSVVAHVLSITSPAAEGTAPTNSRLTGGRGFAVGPQLAIAVSVLLMSVAAFGVIRRPAPVAPRTDFSVFRELGPWRPSLDVARPKFVGGSPDQQVSRIYRGSADIPVHLFIAYFASQSQGKEVVDQYMLTLHGHASPTSVSLTTGDSRWQANEAVYEAGGRRQYVLFWYDVNGRRIASPYLAKVWTVWQSLWRGQTNGAVVMTIAEQSAADPARAAAEARLVAEAAAGALTDFLP